MVHVFQCAQKVHLKNKILKNVKNVMQTVNFAFNMAKKDV